MHLLRNYLFPREIEEDEKFQRQKLFQEFEEMSNQRESDHKILLEEKDSQIYSLQLKVRIYTKL